MITPTKKVEALMPILRDLREAETAHAERLKKIRGDFEESVKELRDAHSTAVRMRETVEAQIRLAAVDAYRETGHKRIADGVAVKLYSVLLYEEKDALAWAKKHGLALKLDTKTFEKIAGTPGAVDCVTSIEEPRAVIDKDLTTLAVTPLLTNGGEDGTM